MNEWSVFHSGALGDLALTLQLSRRLPGVHASSALTLISRADPGDMSAFQPAIRRYSTEGRGLHWLYADSDDPPPARLREFVVDRRILNALGDRDSVVHRQLQRLGPRALYSFDPRPKPEPETHITTQWRRAIEAQGLLTPKCIYKSRGAAAFVAPDDARQRGVELFARLGLASASLLMHPGSGGREKCWPLGYFIDVARLLRAADQPVCFLLGPVELEWWGRDVTHSIRSEFPLIDSPSANDLLALLAAARVLISNDSGPAHLAALIGAPTVTIFGPTSSIVWRPLGPNARVLDGDATATPMDWGIDPKRVVAAASRTIGSDL